MLGYKGKNWRLRKDGLDKEIDPAGSRVKVGKNKITVVLRKVKGQYGADHWMDLVAKRTTGGATQEDPSAGLMDMMKQMYDEVLTSLSHHCTKGTGGDLRCGNENARVTSAVRQ